MVVMFGRGKFPKGIIIGDKTDRVVNFFFQ